MAVTGIVLFVFVLVHMLGEPPGVPRGGSSTATPSCCGLSPAAPLDGAVLLVAVAVHAVAGDQLFMGRARARPSATRSTGQRLDAASRTMIWSGFLILGFVVYHLLDLTVGVTNPDFREGARSSTTSSRASRALAAAPSRRRGGGARVPPLARALVDVPVARRLEPPLRAGHPAASPRRSRSSSPSGSRRSRSRCCSGSWMRAARREGSGDPSARRADPGGPPRAEVAAPEGRTEARQPREQAEAPGDRGGHRARRAPPPRRSASWATRSTASASRTRRGAPTRSPRRAASTPRRTTRTTATRVFRLFYDTVKGGDFRAREANVYRLAELSVNIIDQCVAQGVPFAREYGGALANRSFGGAQVSRPSTRAARPASSSSSAPTRRSSGRSRRGRCACSRAPRCSTSSSSTAGRAGSSCATSSPAGSTRSSADAVVLATGGYGNAFYLSTNAKGSQLHRDLARPPQGRLLREPLLHADPPTCIPRSGEYQSKLTLMSESLRNDGRVWVPKRRAMRARREIPEEERDYYLERKYPSYGNLAPRDVASRAAKTVCDDGRGVGRAGLGVYLDFRDAIRGSAASDRRAVRQPLRDVRADHRRRSARNADADLPGRPLHDGRPVGGLRPHDRRSPASSWRRANFSDHGANRLGASALMQGLADGYFILPYTVGDYLATAGSRRSTRGTPPSATRSARWRSGRGASSRSAGRGRSITSTASSARSSGTSAGWRARRRASSALSRIPSIEEAFWKDLRVTGVGEELNQELEKAGRVADFFELAELMCSTPSTATSPAGGHFRVEYQTPDGEAARNDDEYAYVAAWEWKGPARRPRSTRSRSSSSTSRSSSAATSRRPCGADRPRDLAAAERADEGPVRPVRRARRERAHVVPRDARRPQRSGSIESGRGRRSRSTPIAARASAGCAASS